MQLTYALTTDDFREFCVLLHGGRWRIALWLAKWAALSGGVAFLVLAVLHVNVVAAIVTGASVGGGAALLLCIQLMSAIKQSLPDRDAPGVFDEQHLRIDADGIHTATSLCRSDYAWGFLRECVSWPAVTGIWLNSGEVLVLPTRAIPDRAALIELLRAHCKHVRAVGCPKCGYDTTKSSPARCPECGWDPSGSA